jgi:hypothetical protein
MFGVARKLKAPPSAGLLISPTIYCLHYHSLLETLIMITGLDKLQRQLTDAQKVLESLDGELCTVRFDPNDPESIEAAIQQVWSIIDERVGPHTSNPIIGPLAEEMKEKYRGEILERAATARLEEEDE